MKEYWIYKGERSYIEYGEDISDIGVSISNIDYLVENNIDTDRIEVKQLSQEESDYYEQFFQEDDEMEYVETKYDKVGNVVSLLLDNHIDSLNNWEKNFIYGMKRNINRGTDFTFRQEDILMNIMNKYVA